MKLDFYRGCDYRAPFFVLGFAFGPVMLTAEAELEDAIEEFDERHGERVDFDDAALLDYEGADTQERTFAAMDCGDIRVNGGGTFVWVDPYEWVREFETAREAMAFVRGN